MTGTTRSYRGRSADQRRAERQARLLTAGLDVWGEQGWAAVTVRGVSARAGLTVRYFYESFTDRDALLLAVFDYGFDIVTAAVQKAATDTPGDAGTKLHAALTVLVNALADDPRVARIAMAEPAGSPALEQRRRRAAAVHARFIADQIPARPGDPADRGRIHRTALFCVGGIEELLTTWLGGDLQISKDELIQDCVRLCTVALGRTGD